MGYPNDFDARTYSVRVLDSSYPSDQIRYSLGFSFSPARDILQADGGWVNVLNSKETAETSFRSILGRVSKGEYPGITSVQLIRHTTYAPYAPLEVIQVVPVHSTGGR